jgi:hypothetical protein
VRGSRRSGPKLQKSDAGVKRWLASRARGGGAYKSNLLGAREDWVLVRVRIKK